MRLGTVLSTLVLCVGLLDDAFGNVPQSDDTSRVGLGVRPRRLLQDGLPQQALANIASLAGQLSSLTHTGDAASPIANNAVQLLGAVQAPQSNTYNSNLANAVIGVIGSAVGGQPPTPSTASALIQLLQAVLGSASPSLTALVSQGLRQRNLVPPTVFGPEGNFSDGPDIVQAIAGLLGIAQGVVLMRAPPPLGAVWPPAQGPVPQADDVRSFILSAPTLAPSPAAEPYRLQGGPSTGSLPLLLSTPGATLLQQIQHLLASPLSDAGRAIASGETALLRALHLPSPSHLSSAPAPSLGAASSMPPVGGYAPDTGPSIYPEPAPSPLDQMPYIGSLASPWAAPAIAPIVAPLPGAPEPSVSSVGQPLLALPSLSGVIPELGGDTSASLNVDLGTLISGVQRYGVQEVVNQMIKTFTSYLSTIGNGLTGIPRPANLLQAVQAFTKLFPLPSLLPPKEDVPATFGDPCVKGTLELPYKIGPSCSAKSITLTLVPWSCTLDASNNVLSCSDSFLLYEELPEYCTLLNVSEGTLAGRQCPLEHKLGAEKDVFLGGQIFKLKATDVLTALLANAPSP